MNIQFLNWTVFLITLACLVALFLPVHLVVALSVGVSLLLLKGVQKIWPRAWLQYLLYFSLLISIVIAGVLEGNRFLLFISTLGLLVMWNLDFLLEQILGSNANNYKDLFIKKYLIVLAGIIGTSLVFMVLSTTIQLNFGFGLILLLGIILVFSLSRLLRIHRENIE